MWSLLECHLAIIFACVPSLRAFVRRYLGETFSSFRSRNYSNNTPRTKESSQNTSTLRSNELPADPELGRTESMIEQRVLTKPSRDTVGAQSEEWSTKSPSSSEIAPRIRTADDYEVYALKQLSRYGPKQNGMNGETSQHLSESADMHDLNHVCSPGCLW